MNGRPAPGAPTLSILMPPGRYTVTFKLDGFTTLVQEDAVLTVGQAVRINAVLKLSGVAVAAGDFITAANIASGNLTFTPAADANGAGYASFTFQVQDDGGTANGGVDLDATARTMTIDVVAQNDAPVLTSIALTVSEGQTVTLKTLVYSGGGPASDAVGRTRRGG